MNDNDRITTENFWAVWNSFKWPDPPVPVYRCYYHEDGRVDFYTMEDLPGRCIEVDRETYISWPIGDHVRVVDGKLQISEIKKTIKKLMPSRDQGVACDPRDVCIVVQDGVHVKWKDSENEIN